MSWLRFTVRDFQYNEEEMKADKEEMTRLSTDKKKQFVCLLLTSVTMCVVSGARAVQKELFFFVVHLYILLQLLFIVN